MEAPRQLQFVTQHASPEELRDDYATTKVRFRHSSVCWNSGRMESSLSTADGKVFFIISLSSVHSFS